MTMSRRLRPGWDFLTNLFLFRGIFWVWELELGFDSYRSLRLPRKYFAVSTTESLRIFHIPHAYVRSLTRQ
jgi:hypothetical protein